MPRQKSDVKKGKPTWKPAAMLNVTKTIDGHRARWVHNDRQNILRKQAEGWVFANEITGIKREHEHPEKVEDGHSLTTTTEYRDMVLMALPEEMAKAREEYFNEKTEQQTRGLKRDLEKEMRNGENTAAIHGKIVIE